MTVFDDATPRQKEILTQLGSRMGFNPQEELSRVIYDQEIPVEVSVANELGSAVRNTVAELGSIITDEEHGRFLRNRAANRPVSTAQRNAPIGGTPSDTEIRQINSAAARAAALSESTRNILSIVDPSLSRLLNSGLPSGATVSRQTRDTTVNRFPSSGRDLRVKISDPSRRISQLGGALAPLRQTDYKVVFPFTPEITINHSANYTESRPTHSNYEYLFYQNSTVSEININGVFVARTPSDADYVLAVQHFFRSVTKMFYGQDDIAGLPPIVCRLEGHGDLQFSYIPIVVTNFSVTMPGDVDYISSTNPNAGRVPTSQTFVIQAKPIYSRSSITNGFSLTQFAKGALLGDPDSGVGGFI